METEQTTRVTIIRLIIVHINRVNRNHFCFSLRVITTTRLVVIRTVAASIAVRDATTIVLILIPSIRIINLNVSRGSRSFRSLLRRSEVEVVVLSHHDDRSSQNEHHQKKSFHNCIKFREFI